MRTLACLIVLTAAAVLVSPSRTRGQNEQAGSQNQTQSQAQSSPAPPQDSLAEAARKTRERKKEAPKSAKTFTNDNLPTEGGISTVGESSGAPSTATSTTAAAPSGEKAAPGEKAKPSDEKTWRARFQALRRKLDQDQANLEVMQRELAQLNIQYYDDPNKGLQQQYTRSDINSKTSNIDKMQAQIDADKQAISDAEDELRKSGGDPGWAR